MRCFATRDEGALAFPFGVDQGAGSQASSIGQTATAATEESKNDLDRLGALKSLLANNQALVANMWRRIETLEKDNTRLEAALGELSLKESGAARSPGVGETDRPVGRAVEQLRRIESYLHGTLAQTLWALQVRAARLKEQAETAGVADRLQTDRVLEMTHEAYDEIRTLLVGLRGEDRGDEASMPNESQKKAFREKRRKGRA